jgi:putative ABC transport system permease protein
MVSLTNVDPTLKFVDADSIAQLPSVRRVAELQNAFDVDVTYRDRTRTPAIFGVSPNWLDLRGDEVAEGAFLTTGDNRSMARVAILGSYAKADLFPDEDPIGKTIRVGNVPFVVAGVLAPRGAGPGGGNLDNLVLIPVDTASKRFVQPRLSHHAYRAGRRSRPPRRSRGPDPRFVAQPPSLAAWRAR